MSSIIPPMGEVLTQDPPKNHEDLQGILTRIAKEHNLSKPDWRFRKNRHGASWVVNAHPPRRDGSRNMRAEEWMDMGFRVYGPVLYLSPAECAEMEEETGVIKSPWADGHPMIRVSGVQLLTEYLKKKWGLIHHKSDDSWWILEEYRTEAENYVRGSLIYVAT